MWTVASYTERPVTQGVQNVDYGGYNLHQKGNVLFKAGLKLRK